ncbi:ATP-binding cassette domain-containing protein [Epidermidibacterium keratini]|uniref:ATP-binding cassette domain-containing protein n=1 Tax=Epidermidibacterium keratini TaxID=1891644 RepID=A0A7L4YTH0_9ACTN|nr:ATP-binding cassette domain-containing protein [Epidermidibacterium keratini]
MAVATSELVKTYSQRKREVRAVDGLDLQIRHGEVFGLLGPNGAGKSTTVEILEGYRDRTSGDVSVLGEDPQRAGTGWRSKIGIVLQQTRDLADLSVRESLESFAAFYRNPRPVSEVLELVGLAERADVHGSALSGGLRRRLDVGLGIIGRPELLFLDEPTTGFDPDARRQFWALIEQLNAEGTTILLTSHYLDEVEALAHRVGVIAGGRLLEVNTPDRLGGRGEADAIVSYRDADGQLQRRHTDTPGETVAALFATHGEPIDLTVHRPTLEDVYLQMIGAADDSRDEETADV